MTRARTIADYGKQTADLATQAELDATLFQGVPHIIPGVLYPAVAGKLLDGSTSHSGDYGTAQSDGKSYYYTDIKGSKPIKDPRIGGHFGSQRYPIRGIQLLEQETATHGEDIYSIDGREYFRTWGKNTTKIYDSNGEYIHFDTSNHGHVEIVGYLSGLNMHVQTLGGTGMVYKIDGGSFSAEQTTFQTSVTSPLRGRYVNAGSVVNVFSDQTLGIHTVQLRTHATTDDWYLHGIELIAQDTTSTANKSKIQIPSQNVVSYGKKFTVSGTPHYDPFNGFTNDTTLFSSVVDVATSLGLGTATTWGAPWDKGSDNHIRPFNGGRVVKWVDSSGTIKTSVTMMPANAQNISTTASNEITTASATNSHTINFSDDAVENSLSEVAKTFHWREFGNGNANGGPTGTYKDASMLDGSSRDIAYVMDDGLTSLAGDDVVNDTDLLPYANDDLWYMTFIGTGVTRRAKQHAQVTQHIAQNLPYGTHILKCVRQNGGSGTVITLDGISLGTIADGTYGELDEITFHQPKKPPIPEDAVVLADYMLMADHVVQTAEGLDKLSKGTRVVSGTRDVFYDGGSPAFQLDVTNFMGMSVSASNNASNLSRIPAFGTNAIKRTYIADARYQNFYINDTGHSSAATTTKVGSGHGSFYYPSSSVALGTNIFETFGNTNNSATTYTHGWEIVTPIHTSSHYQTFETPFLHELLGGDRNMEQHNLVVTPDGKTWDEVTRDTSYIGLSTGLEMFETPASTNLSTSMIDHLQRFRGKHSNREAYTKGMALAYDRIIVLEDGWYYIDTYVRFVQGSERWIYISKNGSNISSSQNSDYNATDRSGTWGSTTHYFKRGDYIIVSTNSLNCKGTADDHIHIRKLG